MAGLTKAGEALQAWLMIPAEIEKALQGLPEEDLDLRGGPDGWSIRETVHHLVEANLVASNIVIAALARACAMIGPGSLLTPPGCSEWATTPRQSARAPRPFRHFARTSPV